MERKLTACKNCKYLNNNCYCKSSPKTIAFDALNGEKTTMDYTIYDINKDGRCTKFKQKELLKSLLKKLFNWK